MQNTNWGILAPGNIAAKFAHAIKSVDGATLYSIASRSPERAAAFAHEHGVSNVARDYEELINDPDVDAIYVASPHTFHAEQSIACLNAGKAVLCEKPMTVNAAQAERVIAAARDNQTFYMEAVWTRFLPVFKKLREWLESGSIGEVKMINANFGFHFPYDPQGRLFNPNLAGGALLDLGIYPITFAQWVMGDLMPTRISALGTLCETGVDDNAAINLMYPGGEIASLTTAAVANTDYNGWIIGTKGRIKVPFFWCAESAELIVSDRTKAEVVDKFELAHSCNGYEGEIVEVQRCLAQGLIESPTLPWETSLRVMQIMDEVRQQLGVTYPFENQ